MTGIYKFTSPDGKIYVGQAKNIDSRYNQHKWGKKFVNDLFLESVNKFGFDAHVFEILEECEISELNNRERYYQDLFNVCGVNGLNCRLTPTADNPIYIRPETLVKMGAPKKGRILTQEHKAKIGASKVGKKRDPELMKRIILTRKPQIYTEERKRNFSEKMKGHTFNRGKVRSEEFKQQVSQLSKKWHENNLHPASKILLDTMTGIFYFQLKEAAIAHNIKPVTLVAMMKGRNRNRTNLIYA